MSTNVFDAANWMRDSLEVLGEKSLDKLCLPGSHDAGMSKVNKTFGFASSNNTLTQTFNIKKQLELGIRYFDIRPVRCENEYYCGHTDTVEIIGYQGALGQSIKDVIANINEFTSGDRRELIMLDISHCEVAARIVNTESKYESINYTTDDWKGLFKLLHNINNKLTIQDVAYTEMLTNNTLSFLLQNGSKVIIFISGRHIIKALDSLPDYVFYNDERTEPSDNDKEKLRVKSRYDNRISIYNEYANKNTVNEMLSDQSKKYKKNGNTYFLLSWTLTLSVSQVIFNSIIKLAREADKHLDLIMRDFEVSGNHMPNIIFVDDVINNHPALLSMMINYKKHKPERLFTLPPFWGLLKETHTSNWGRTYEAVVPFTYNGSTYIFGHSHEDYKWFVSKLEPYGNVVDQEVLNGNWKAFYPYAVPFEYEKEPYMFTQMSTPNIKKKWYISKLSNNEFDIEAELASGYWNNQYTTGVSFKLDGQPYLFSQTWTDNRYFISKLDLTTKSLNEELVSGSWGNYYSSTVVFYFDGEPYLFGQSNSPNYRCFMSKLSLDKQSFNKELFCDTWNNFYGTLVTFEYGGEPYLFGQTSTSNNRFFISKLNPKNPSEVNKELISGKWEHYYNKACVFTYDSKTYLFGLTHDDSKRVFISELFYTI